MVMKSEICPCFASFSCDCEISGLQIATAMESEDLHVPERERSSQLIALLPKKAAQNHFYRML